MIRSIDHSFTKNGMVLEGSKLQGTAEGLEQFAEYLKQLIDLKSKILDVGAQDGWLNNWLVSNYYVSVDIQSYIGVQLVADAHFLPFLDNSFDLVISKQTLPHFSDPIKVCKELFRCCSKVVVIRQEWPNWPHDTQSIGWSGHSKCQIDKPEDLYPAFEGSMSIDYNGKDLVVLKC